MGMWSSIYVVGRVWIWLLSLPVADLRAPFSVFRRWRPLEVEASANSALGGRRYISLGCGDGYICHYTCRLRLTLHSRCGRTVCRRRGSPLQRNARGAFLCDFHGRRLLSRAPSRR